MKLPKRKTSESIQSKKKVGSPLKRIKSIKWIPVNIADLVIKIFNSIKNAFVYRSYWGRSNTYKQAVHIAIFVITIVVAFSGVSYRIFGLNESSQSLSSNYLGNAGNVDLLQQGGSVQSLIASISSTPFKINYYQVQSGDSLQSIAEKFGVSKETIKWSNVDKYGNYDSYTNETVNIGDELKIPEITGVLYEVREGDTLDSILNKTSGDRFTTIEVNQIQSDNSIVGRQTILVPDGRLAAPQPPLPVYNVFYRPRPAAGDCTSGTGTPINGITLSNPLCSKDCEGYTISQYYSGPYPLHDGIDLSKGGGCTESALCDGIITFAGDAGFNNGGYVVKIDCGNGVVASYFHGDGNIWVSAGDKVTKGQPVQYMGCTGWCTGTHLHLIIKVNGVTVDPGPYVPL